LEIGLLFERREEKKCNLAFDLECIVSFFCFAEKYLNVCGGVNLSGA
jgi:hypothetical protein